MADKINVEGFSVSTDNVCTAEGGFVGTFSGTVIGKAAVDLLDFTETPFVADGSITGSVSFAQLDASSASTVMTISAPTVGQFLILSCVDASNTCTVTCTAGDFDGAGGNVATFDAAEETLIVLGISATRYVIIENIGGVVLS